MQTPVTNERLAAADMSAQAIIETINDGSEVMVIHVMAPTDLGGVPTRVTSVVKVKKVPRRDLAKFLPAMADEVLEVMLYTDQQKAWVEDLEDESFDTIIEEGRRLNFSRFETWLNRRKVSMKALGLGEDFLEKTITQAVQKAALDAAARTAPSDSPKP